MQIKKEEAYQHILCMDLSRHHFHVGIIDLNTKKVVDSVYHDVDVFDRESIEKFIQDDFFKYEYNNIIVSAGTERNTLVPTDIFNESGAKEIFKLNFSEPYENIDYNRIPELGMVNIYEFPMWSKSMFVVKFPRAKIVHRSSVLLRAVFDQPTFRPKANLYIDDKEFYLMITSKSKLQFFNRFDAEALSDIAYHTLNVVGQKEIDRSELEFQIFGKASDWDGLDELSRLFDKKVKVDSSSEKSDKYMLAKQLLCV